MNCTTLRLSLFLFLLFLSLSGPPGLAGASHQDIEAVSVGDEIHYLERFLSGKLDTTTYVEQNPEKILVHIAGDLFGDGTQLEGGDSHAMLSQLIGYLSLMAECKSSDRTKGVAPTRSQLLALTAPLKRGLVVYEQGFLTNIGRFQRILTDTLNALAVGESLLLPSGWTGHAVALEVRKDDSDRYRVRLYNTGLGIERYHPTLARPIERSLHPYIEISDIPQRTLTCATLLRVLQEARQLPGDGAPKPGADDLYIPLIELLQGTLTHPVADAERLIAPQRSGTCSWRALMGWLSQNTTSAEAFQRIEWELQFKALWDYHKVQNPLKWSEEVPRRLFTKALDFWANTTLLMHQRRVISDDELVFANERLKYMRQGLEDTKWHRTNNDELSVSITPETVDRLHVPIDSISLNIPQPLEAEEYQPSAYVNASIDHYALEPETLNDNLRDIVATVEEAVSKGHYRIVQHATSELALRLPLLGETADNYWNKFPGSLAEEVLISLQNLSVVYLRSHITEALVSSTGDNAKVPMRYLTQAKLLSVADLIAQKFAHEIGVRIPRVPLGYWTLNHLFEVLDTRSGTLHLQNPAWEHETRQLRLYWEDYSKSYRRDPRASRRAPGTFRPCEMDDYCGWFTHEEESDTPNGDVEWIIEWMQDDDIATKISEVHPELASETEWYTANFLLTDKKFAYSWRSHFDTYNMREHRQEQERDCLHLNGRDGMGERSPLLPKAFTAVRDIAASLSYIENMQLARSPIPRMQLDYSKGLEYPALLELNFDSSGIVTRKWQLGHSLFGLPSVTRPKDYPDDADSSNTWASTSRTVLWAEYWNYRNPPHSDFIENAIWEFASRALLKNYQSEDRVMAELNADFEGLQDHRQLAPMAKYPGLQVRALLGYFSQHAHLLDDWRYRNYLKALLLDREVLANRYRQDPEAAPSLAEELAHFCRQRLRNSQQLGDLEATLFYIELNRLLSEYTAQHALKHEPLRNIFKDDIFDDHHDTLQTLFNNPSLTPSEHALVARDLARSYVSHGIASSFDVAELFTAVHTHQNRFDQTETSKSLRADDEANDAMITLRSTIESIALSSPSEVLSAINERMSNAQEAIDWDLENSQFPIYVGSQGKTLVEINLIEGSYWKGGVKIHLPERILSSELFQTHIQESKSTLVDSMGGFLLITDSEDNEYRLYNSAVCHNIATQSMCTTTRSRLQKRIDGVWYELIDTQDLTPDQLGLFDYYDAWIEVGGSRFIFTDPKSRLPTYQGTGKIENVEACESDTQYNIRGIEDVSFYNRPSESRCLHLLHQPTEAAYRTLELPGPVEWVNNKLPEFLRLENLLLPRTPSVWKWISRIEVPNRSLVWVDNNTNDIAYIGMPRLRLQFKGGIDQKGNSRYFSVQYPGYYVSPDQHLDQLQDFTRYLVLERTNSHGQIERIAIFPRLTPVRSEKNTLITKPTIAIEHELKTCTDAPSILHFMVDPTTGSLVPDTDEARYFLALLLCWEHDYDAAAAQLRHYGEHLGALNEGQRQVLEWIANSDEWNEDPDPRISAIILHAKFLLARNEHYYAKHTGSSDSAELEDPQTQLGPVSRYISEQLLTTDERQEMRRLSPSHEAKYPHRFLQEIQAKETISRSTLFSDYLEGQQPTIADINNFGAMNVKQDQVHEYSMLRPSIFEDFAVLYRICKGFGTRKDVHYILERHAHLSFGSDAPVESLLMELDLVLKVIASNRDSREALAAQILQEVRLNPSEFPSAKEIAEAMKGERAIRINMLNMLIERIDWNKERSHVQEPASTTLVSNTPLSTETIDLSVKIPEMELRPFLPLETRLDAPLIPEIWNYIDVVPQSDERPHNAKSPIEAVFSVDSHDSFISNHLDSIRRELSEGKKEESTFTHAVVKDHEGLSRLLRSLRTTRSSLSKTVTQNATEIVELLGQPLSDSTAQARRELSEDAKLRTEPVIDDAILAYVYRDIDLFIDLNPSLALDEALALNESVHKYLLNATLLQHYDRIIHAIETVLKVRVADADEWTQDLLTKKLVEVVQMQRHYSPHEHPELLVFEYHLNILLRQVQVDSLQKFTGNIETPDRHSGAVMELIMGSGKTMVLLPVLGHMIAKSGQLPLLIMPQELVPSTAQALQNSLGQSYHTAIEVIDIGRKWPSKPRDFELLRYRFESAIDTGKMLLMSNHSLQCLWLHLLDSLADLKAWTGSEYPEDKEARLRNLQAVFTILTTNTHVLVDEVDTVFDIQRSHHFSRGTRRNIHPHILDASMEFYYQLINTVVAEGLVEIEDTQTIKNALNLSPNLFDTQVNKALAKALSSPTAFKDNRAFQEFLSQQSDDELQIIRHYLLGGDRIPEIAMSSQADTDEVMNLLSVLREQICRLYPLTSSKKLFTHYGPQPLDKMHNAEADYAIPYHLGRPTLQSVFGTDLETVNYTIQMTLQNGIRRELVTSKLQRLRAQMKAETLNPFKKDEEPSAAVEFRELCGDQLDPLSLQRLSETDIDTVFEHINSDWKLQLQVLREATLPKIPGFDEQLSSDAHIYGALFDHIQAFTGTLWNLGTFPDAFAHTYSSTTRPNTLHLLWDSSPHTVGTINTDDTAALAQKVQDLFAAANIDPTSIIDAAGHFREYSNESVAREIVALAKVHVSSPFGVIYYDTSGLQWVQQSSSDRPIPIAECQLNREQLLAFWDQQHTTGSDLKVKSDTTAVVTVGKHSIMRDLLQAVWRLRQLNQAQRVTFVVDARDAEAMRLRLQELSQDVDTCNITLADILLYTEYNQICQQGKQNSRTLPYKLNAIAIRSVLPTLLSSDVPIEALISLYSLISPLVETSTPMQPHQIYGGHRTLVSNTDYVEDKINRFLNIPVVSLPDERPCIPDSDDMEALHSALRDAASDLGARLPDTIEMPQHFENEIAVEVEAEEEQEQEQEAEVEVENQKNLNGRYDSEKTPIDRATWEHLTYIHGLNFSPIELEDVRALEPNSCHHYCIGDRQPVFAFADVLKHREDLMPGIAQRISPRILTSINLTPLYRLAPTARPYLALEETQKEISHVLIVADRQSEEFTLVLLDVEDASWWDNELLRGRRLEVCDGNIPLPNIGLYQIDTGLYRRLDHAWDVDTFITSSEFLNTITQVKFFSGRTRYSQAEYEVLKKWLSDLNPAVLENDFVQRILKERPHSRDAYPKSVLKRLFNSLHDLNNEAALRECKVIEEHTRDIS